MEEVNLYESTAFGEITAPVIRPGGFGLTARGMAHCRLAPGARVLDVGCGTGAAVDYLRRRGLAAMGLDFSTVLLEKGTRTYGAAPLARARAEQLPMADGCCAAVLSECVLSLCHDPLHVLGEMRRVLQPGGYLVLTDVYARGNQAAARTGGTTVRCCLQGAVDRSTVKDRVTASAFDLLLWEDHSARLKQLAARLIWSYGSLDAFWSAVGGPDAAAAMRGNGAGGCCRPGYYLLVAKKITDR
ncbi:MAG: class I SAM-dependent methyltransferase [Desulfobacteraceae bacterium]|jgi:SAM-dependent methyltransferase